MLHGKELLVNDYLQIDESSIAEQSSTKKGATHTGYMWVYCSPIKRLVLFEYHPGRAGSNPRQILENYQGTIQADAYAAYDQFERKKDITVLGCMAHVHRKFENALANDESRTKYVLDELWK